MSSSPAPPSTPEGPGSVSGAPNLPSGFTDTFTSRYVDTGDVRLHAVVGGDGPALAADPRLARIPVGEAALPGISPPVPLILPVDRLWHIPFNQLKETNEQLVRGARRSS